VPYCWETKSDNYKGEENNNKNRVTPHPPIALLNFLKFARQLLISRSFRGCVGMCGGSSHAVEMRGNTLSLTKLVCPVSWVKTVRFPFYKLVTPAVEAPSRAPSS